VSVEVGLPRLRASWAPPKSRTRGWIKVGLVVAAILFAALVLPVLAPYGSVEVLKGHELQAPSSAHWFGTDINQMDVFSRVLAGARVDIGIAVIATLAAFVVGFPLGIVVGYYSGIGSAIFLRLLDMVQAFPVLVLVLALVALTGGGTTNVIYAQVFVGTPIMVRVVRSVVISLREERYIEAAVATGNTDRRLLLRHVAPHALPVALIQATILMASALILTTSLSFIGIGVRAPAAEWGSMVALGSQDLASGQWWTIVFPGVAIAVSVFLFNLLGQLLRRQFAGAES